MPPNVLRISDVRCLLGRPHIRLKQKRRGKRQPVNDFHLLSLFLSFPSLPATHDGMSSIPLHGHQRPLLAGLPSSQTGIFRGASSREVSATADIPGSHFERGRGYDGRHGKGSSGVTATEIIRRSSIQESSRLWQPSQGRGLDLTRKSYGGKVQSYASYLGTLQQMPKLDYSGYKNTNKPTAMRPYGEHKMSTFLGSGRQTAPQVLPMGRDQTHSRGNTIPRGQSYLFNHPQNSAATVKPVSSTLSFGRDQQMGSEETRPHAHPPEGMEAIYDASSQRSTVSIHVSGATHVSKPTRTPKRLYGFRGFDQPTRRANKELSKEDSGQHGFSKGRLKMSSMYSSLSAKNRFSQREKQEGAQRDVSLTTQIPFTPGSKETRLLVPGRANESNPDQFSRLQGFDSPALEGAKPLIHKSDKPVEVQPGFEGFLQTNSQIWGPEKRQIHWWYKGTRASSGDVSAAGELRGEDPKPNGSTEAEGEFTPDMYKKNRKIFTFLTFHLNQTHQDIKEQNHATTPAGSRISPAIFGTAGNQSELGYGPKLPRNSHQSTSRDATNATVSRSPKRPPRLWSFIYTDLLGNASFSHIGTKV